MCVCIYTVCVCAPTCHLFIICAGARVYTPVCVFFLGSVCMRVYPGSFNQRPIVGRCGGPVSFFFPLIKLCVSMPVTYLIWDAPLSSPHLAAAHTDSTLLHTSMTLAPPEEDDEGEKDEEIERWRSKGWTGIWHLFFVFIVAYLTCWLRV